MDFEAKGQTQDTYPGQSLQGGPCQAGEEPWPREAQWGGTVTQWVSLLPEYVLSTVVSSVSLMNAVNTLSPGKPFL